MDLEELNKTQIILLTLLVSFVTSIATGIVTVSLMSQAPQSITQTVNRIVERTVEKVVPSAVDKPKEPQQTVVIKEDDVVADSISKVRTSVIRLVVKGEGDEAFYARGVIVNASGAAVVSRGVIDPQVTSEAILSSGVRVPFTVRKGDVSSIAILDLDLKNATTTKIVAAPLADATKNRLGQTVILLSGKGRDTIAQGVLSALPSPGDSPRAPYLEATVAGTLPGGVLINIFGEIVGIVTNDALLVDSGLYTPASAIAHALTPPQKSDKDTSKSSAP